MNSLYDFKTTTLSGAPADLSAYHGRVSLVVNVASRCGFTPQYEPLEKLYGELRDRGFAVFGFPSNDFAGQEPGTPEQISAFCQATYAVTFPMFAKVRTRSGPDQSPIYAFLGQSGNLPSWNFAKYVIAKDGQVVAFFPSQVAPDAPKLRAAVLNAISA